MDKIGSILKGKLLLFFLIRPICTLTILIALLLTLCLLLYLCCRYADIVFVETYGGAFHDAAQEEQVDVFGSRGSGSRTRIIQHLLHG